MAYIMWLLLWHYKYRLLYYIGKEVSAALLALCPGLLTPVLIAWTVLLTQDDFYTTNVSHNFITWIITHKARFPCDKCFIDAFYLLAAWHENKLILQDAWLWMVLDWDDPLSGRLHKCLLLRKKKQQRLAIFCLGNGIFGDMATDQDTWLLRINVLRDLNSCWLQVDWPQVANETTLNPVFYFLMLG